MTAIFLIQLRNVLNKHKGLSEYLQVGVVMIEISVDEFKRNLRKYNELPKKRKLSSLTMVSLFMD